MECDVCQGDPSLICPRCTETHCRYCGDELMTEFEEMTGWCEQCEEGRE